MVQVAIDARVPNGGAGGVQHVLTGMAAGFSSAHIPDLTRTWIVYRNHIDWLTPHLPPEDNVIVFEPLIHRVGLAVYSRAPRLISRLRPYLNRFISTQYPDQPGPLDADLKRRGVQVLHLPVQDGLPTRLPYLYHPHDLQHRYLPHFFTPAQIQHRETAWRRLALGAAAVSVGTQSVANDLETAWNIPSDLIETIPLAPVPTVHRVRPQSPASPVPVVLYPASFWPHKNHATLIAAAARVRDKGTPLALRFPGAPSGDPGTVRRHLKESGFNPDEVMPGFISDAALAEHYATATVVAVPSLFEAASFPIWEAFAAEVPVIASTVTSLPQQVGDAGILADPHDVGAWEDALHALLTDSELRTRLTTAGQQRIEGFSWERFALAHTALYRRIVGEPPRLSEITALREGPTL